MEMNDENTKISKRGKEWEDLAPKDRREREKCHDEDKKIVRHPQQSRPRILIPREYTGSRSAYGCRTVSVLGSAA